MTRTSLTLYGYLSWLVILTIVLAFNSVTYSQKARSVEFQINYDFSSLGDTDSVKFMCMIPGSIDKVQTVQEIKYSHPPRAVTRVGDNNYAEFIFDEFNKKIQLSIDVTVDMFRRDFKASGKRPIVQDSMPLEYLVEEKYIELSDPGIKLMAENLNHDDPLKTAKRIFRYVCQNIEYSGFNAVDLGAAKGFEQKHGDCSEFADVFVALCRANDIPSRFVEGITVEFSNTPFHAWAEIYLEEGGWVRIDPTPGHAINFSALYNKYIQLSNRRSDEVLGESFRYKYLYWGDAVKVRETVKFK